MSLRDEAITHMARQLNEDGWTCEGHEPGSWCEPCKKVQRLSGTHLLDALLDFLDAHTEEWVRLASGIELDDAMQRGDHKLGDILVAALRGTTEESQ